jgi:hypothetical protein
MDIAYYPEKERNVFADSVIGSERIATVTYRLLLVVAAKTRAFLAGSGWRRRTGCCGQYAAAAAVSTR